jgi:hypothetical protein
MNIDEETARLGKLFSRCKARQTVAKILLFISLAGRKTER